MPFGAPLPSPSVPGSLSPPVCSVAAGRTRHPGAGALDLLDLELLRPMAFADGVWIFATSVDPAIVAAAVMTAVASEPRLLSHGLSVN